MPLLQTLRNRVMTALSRPEVVAAASGLTVRVRFETEGGAFDIVARNGILMTEHAEREASICVSASDSTWRCALEPIPEPGFQSFTAWQLNNPGYRVAGDALLIAQSRAFMEMLVENLRPVVPQPRSFVLRSFAPITGRYYPLAGPSGRSVIYAEVAGAGRPIVCLHTAGADSRQYHGLLTDLELAESFKMIAFDMPFHGRSSPPAGWTGTRYALDQASYRDWCVAFLEQVVAAPAILIGCSMGAAIAMVIAAERPELVRALIALEAPVRPRGRRNPYLTHAAVHGGMHCAAYVRGLMAPTSPTADRALAAFIYSQGAPGIYDGDLEFYSDEFDGEQVARRIDGRRMPVYFITGRYDYSATTEDARQLAALIEGAELIEMADLGHFPMIEHPDRFRGYIVPVLAAIAARPAAGGER
jgi:pimeloyl-ACP methyl ester carboxylesterase